VSSDTKPEVFIIESLDPDDEGNGRFEGAIISRMLELHGKNPKYRYVRTREQLEKAVAQFGTSNFRYLHISCHADAEGMITTNQDEIDFDDLAVILNPHLKNKRLFLSACEMVHSDLAEAIIPQSGCYSVIGPREAILFTDAAVFWTSLYHLMFSQSTHAMKRGDLLPVLRNISKLFGVNISYFSRSSQSQRGITKDLLSS